MNRTKIYEDYLKTHNVPELVAKKINTQSYLTDNFAYQAFRIGNSIGDHLDISIEIVFLDEIAKKHGVVLNTTEHAELHSTGISQKDLEQLIAAAVQFENMKHNKHNYKESLIRIKEFIRQEFGKVVID
jgi:hypothetical protein